MKAQDVSVHELFRLLQVYLAKTSYRITCHLHSFLLFFASVNQPKLIVAHTLDEARQIDQCH